MSTRKLPNRMICVTGDDFERSFQQGRFFQDQINAILKSIRELEILPYNLQKALPLSLYRLIFFKEGKFFLKQHEELFHTYAHSDLKKKISGLAEGLKVSLALTYGLSALEALSSEMPHRIPQMGCTSLAFESQQTAEHTPVIGYNHDFPLSFGSHLFVRHNKPKQGFESLSLTYPILLGCIAGINRAGLGVSLNHAFEKKIIKNQPAMFVSWLLQECLNHCKTVQEAIDLILQTPVTNGSMITIIDAQGNRAVVEVSSKVRVLRKSDEGICYSFNKYRDSKLEALELPLHTIGTKMFRGRLIHECNIERLKRFEKIFDAHHKYTDEEIRKILSDHDDTKGDMQTICRHHQSTSSTIASALLKPGKGEMKVIYGAACQGEYQLYSFAKESKNKK